MGYNLDMGQTACLVVNPITVDNSAYLFNLMAAVQVSDMVMASS